LRRQSQSRIYSRPPYAAAKVKEIDKNIRLYSLGRPAFKAEVESVPAVDAGLKLLHIPAIINGTFFAEAQRILWKTFYLHETGVDSWTRLKAGG